MFGRAIVIRGVNDGRDPIAPVNMQTIQTIDFANVVDKRFVAVYQTVQDALSPNYGEPEIFSFTNSKNGQVTYIHASRVILCKGVLTSPTTRSQNAQWDQSVLQAIHEVIRDFQSGWHATAIMMLDANQAVMKIDGFIDMITSGGANANQTMETRMQIMDMARSVARSVVIDAESEEFSKQPTLFSGVADMLDRWMARIAAAAETPITVLMGRSPAGENATGESDFQWFYDTIKTDQVNVEEPQLRQFYDLLFAAKAGPFKGKVPDNYSIVFAPLKQQTPKEEAEEQKLRADTDALYIDRNVLTPEEVALSRFLETGYGRKIVIDRDLRLALQNAPDVPTDVSRSLLTPTDLARVILVNEARAAEGLRPLPGDDGSMTVGAFLAKLQLEEDIAKAKALPQLGQPTTTNTPEET